MRKPATKRASARRLPGVEGESRSGRTGQRCRRLHVVRRQNLPPAIGTFNDQLRFTVVALAPYNADQLAKQGVV
ncbi:hypothetical protein [Microvirga yunnanensis]|uniref:hypothetical protein n=1 Tax=Microvirga yunnanensis TaxID=2953740 RepID=UPI0021C5FDA2|nr:hypothetical protein [Microvirga sp. HBU65207]